MRNGKWLRLLAYVTGSVNQELLLRNEYLAAENRILRAKLLRIPSQGNYHSEVKEIAVPRRSRLGNPS